MKKAGVVALALFVASVYVANLLVARYGIVKVPFTNLYAPAAVYAAGVALVLRDFIQETLGRLAVVGGIAAGALLSLLVSPTFAVASASAFLLAEACDFAVYDALRRKTLVGGVVASNIVGAAIDSALFLWLAFGSEAFFAGQFVAKIEMTVPALILIGARRAVTA